MPREPVIYHRVIGMEKIHHRTVTLQHLTEEGDRLITHRLHQQWVKMPVHLGIDLQKIQ